jgi:hypothetical protein
LVEVIASDALIDAAAGTLSVTVRLKNAGTALVASSLTLVLDGAESKAFEEIRVRNADNKRPGRGALWRFQIRGSSALLPGAVTAPRVLSWNVAGPREPGLGTSDRTPEPLEASFVVFARVEESRRAAQ